MHNEVQEAVPTATIVQEKTYKVHVLLSVIRVLDDSKSDDSSSDDDMSEDRDPDGSHPGVRAQQMIDRVHVQLVVVAVKKRKKRTTYTADQKALALRVLEKSENSPAQAARRLLLWYPEHFPDMTEITGEKNIRLWQKQAEKAAFATEQDAEAAQRCREKPAGTQISPVKTCQEVVYRMILQQVPHY